MALTSSASASNLNLSPYSYLDCRQGLLAQVSNM
jgi:hypothetical protein